MLGFFEGERDDGETLIAILLVELDKVLRFVVAVRAPGSGHDRQHNFVLEERVFAGHRLAVEVREVEGEGLVRVAHCGVCQESSGSGRFFAFATSAV